MPTYSNDPRWIWAKFPSKCKACEKGISRGERVFYFPLMKAVYCEPCGEPHSRRFDAEAADEALMSSQY